VRGKAALSGDQAPDRSGSNAARCATSAPNEKTIIAIRLASILGSFASRRNAS